MGLKRITAPDGEVYFLNENGERVNTGLEVPKGGVKIKSTNPKSKLKAIIFLAFAVGILAMFILSSVLNKNGNSPDKTVNYNPDKIDAYVMSQVFVEQKLKAPSTAEFPTSRNASITKINDVFTVSCYVDAQNSFGAQIRTNYTAKLYYNFSTKKWHLESLEFNK